MSFGSLENSKATPTAHWNVPSYTRAAGMAKNAVSFAMKVGRGMGQMAGAAGKAVIGQDDFTKQVSRQAKNKY